MFKQVKDYLKQVTSDLTVTTTHDGYLKAMALLGESQNRPVKRKYGYLDAGTVQHKFKKRDGSVKIVEVPVRYEYKLDRSKYTAEKLRQFRAERGVGRPPKRPTTTMTKTETVSHVG